MKLPFRTGPSSQSVEDESSGDYAGSVSKVPWFVDPFGSVVKTILMNLPLTLDLLNPSSFTASLFIKDRLFKAHNLFLLPQVLPTVINLQPLG